MTHGSSSSNKLTEDYQELEFLGDFVLNFLSSRQLEKQSRNSLMTPGAMSQKRSILISNNVFAWMSVQNSFHKYIRLECPSAKNEIDRFITLVKNAEEKISTLSKREKKEKQHMFKAASQEAPKILADIFESVAGAIYRDSGDEIDVV